MHEGSYNDIHAGMPVVGPDGDTGWGRVDEVLYDEASDIFVGLVIERGGLLSKQRLMVPGEHVVSVHGDRVTINAPEEALEPYLSPEERAAQARQEYTGHAKTDEVLI